MLDHEAGMTFETAAHIVAHPASQTDGEIVEAAMLIITSGREDDILAHLNACHAMRCVLAKFLRREAMNAETLH
jgi:hypothetical protein